MSPRTISRDIDGSVDMNATKEALKVKVVCPSCHKSLSMHALAYKHKCKTHKTFDSKKQYTMECAQKKIIEKYGCEAKHVDVNMDSNDVQ